MSTRLQVSPSRQYDSPRPGSLDNFLHHRQKEDGPLVNNIRSGVILVNRWGELRVSTRMILLKTIQRQCYPKYVIPRDVEDEVDFANVAQIIGFSFWIFFFFHWEINAWINNAVSWTFWEGVSGVLVLLITVCVSVMPLLVIHRFGQNALDALKCVPLILLLLLW